MPLSVTYVLSFARCLFFFFFFAVNRLRLAQTIEKTVQTAPYSHTKVAQWNQEIVEGTIKALSALNRPYKYIGTLVLVCLIAPCGARADTRHPLLQSLALLCKNLEEASTQQAHATGTTLAMVRWNHPSGL